MTSKALFLLRIQFQTNKGALPQLSEAQYQERRLYFWRRPQNMRICYCPRQSLATDGI